MLISPEMPIEKKTAVSEALFPATEQEISAVRNQLYRMLASALFSNSKRYPKFLRYVVEKTLDGHVGDLKERTLGVEVFGRDPDYDTALDAIVRITAGEIRKRIAQYYHEPGHEEEVRIDLPSGSYVPEFRLPLQTAPSTSAPEPQVAPIDDIKAGAQLSRHKRLPLYIVAVVCVVAAGAFLWFRATAGQSAIDRFWHPVIDSHNQVLVCIGEQNKSAPHNVESDPTVEQSNQEMEHINIQDGIAMSRLISQIQGAGKNYQVQSVNATTFTDLQREPVVLVGGLNNEWTLHLLSRLRYTFRAEPNFSTIAVVDAHDPLQDRWSVDANATMSKLPADYAIVARFLSPETDEMVVIAAGLGAQGTMVAGEFLTEPEYLAAFAKQAPRDWAKKNMEIVLRAEMINGKPGPPRVIATDFW